MTHLFWCVLTGWLCLDTSWKCWNCFEHLERNIFVLIHFVGDLFGSLVWLSLNSDLNKQPKQIISRHRRQKSGEPCFWHKWSMWTLSLVQKNAGGSAKIKQNIFQFLALVSLQATVMPVSVWAIWLFVCRSARVYIVRCFCCLTFLSTSSPKMFRNFKGKIRLWVDPQPQMFTEELERSPFEHRSPCLRMRSIQTSGASGTTTPLHFQCLDLVNLSFECGDTDANFRNTRTVRGTYLIFNSMYKIHNFSEILWEKISAMCALSVKPGDLSLNTCRLHVLSLISMFSDDSGWGFWSRQNVSSCSIWSGQVCKWLILSDRRNWLHREYTLSLFRIQYNQAQRSDLNSLRQGYFAPALASGSLWGFVDSLHLFSLKLHKQLWFRCRLSWPMTAKCFWVIWTAKDRLVKKRYLAVQITCRHPITKSGTHCGGQVFSINSGLKSQFVEF